MSFVDIFSGRVYYEEIDSIYKTNLHLIEAIINPGNLNLKSTDIQYLSKVFPDIIFKDIPQGYNAKYSSKDDIIYVNLSKGVSIDEIEAIINHEIIHREQHKRSNGKFLEQTEKLVKKINDFEKKMDKNNSKDIEKYYKLLSTFSLSSPQEKMTYSYQLVKMRNDYGFKSPNDIVKFLEKYNSKSNERFEVDNKMKKYIGMYWIIKEHI